MKKIVLVALAMMGISFASCGNRCTTCSDTCDSVAVDSVADSLVVDSAAVDSVVAE